jgi:hypothetical protein
MVGGQMTDEDIIRMAEKAGLVDTANAPWLMEFLERFAKLVAEAEREECAKVAQETVCDQHIPTGIKIYGTRAAKAIRARGKE